MLFFKKLIIKIIPYKLKKIIYNDIVRTKKGSQNYETVSYSQEGEDLVIRRFLESKKKGFYVDIGSHHPKRFSNTYLFYKLGWNGINIDAMPGSMEVFNKERERDINLEMAVSNSNNELIYYMFNEPALNTFSKDEAEKKHGLREYKIIDKKKIKTLTLKSILDDYCPKNVKIDFMSIDVEGLDVEVIQSNDWEKYRPSILLVEDLKKSPLLELPLKSELYNLIIKKEFVLVAKTYNTLIFKDNRV